MYQAGRDVIIHQGEDQKRHAKHIVITLGIVSVVLLLIIIFSQLPKPESDKSEKNSNSNDQTEISSNIIEPREEPKLSQENQRERLTNDIKKNKKPRETDFQDIETSSQKIRIVIKVNLDRNGAKIFIDKKPVGTAPCSIDVLSGLHELQIVYENISYGYKWVFKDTISVMSEKTIYVKNSDFQRLTMEEKDE